MGLPTALGESLAGRMKTVQSTHRGQIVTGGSYDNSLEYVVWRVVPYRIMVGGFLRPTPLGSVMLNALAFRGEDLG